MKSSCMCVMCPDGKATGCGRRTGTGCSWMLLFLYCVNLKLDLLYVSCTDCFLFVLDGTEIALLRTHVYTGISVETLPIARSLSRKQSKIAGGF